MIYKSYLVENNFSVLKEKLTLFYGENLGLKNDYKEKIKKVNKDAEILRFNNEELIKNKNLVLNEILNVSLFEKKKVFIIETVSDKFIELVEEMENIITEQKIFLFADILDKKSKLRNHFEKSKKCAIIACYEDNSATIKKIIELRLKEYSGLSSYNLNLILDNVDLNRAKLNNELGKIETFYLNKKIETNTLKILLNSKTNDDFNKLRDEALLGNKNKTNELLSNTILEEEKHILYINSINQRLHRLYDIDDLNNIENSLNKIKPPIFWKDKPNFINQAKKWNKKKIKKILNQTFETEKVIKSNRKINNTLAVKKLIIDICNTANF